MKKLSSYLLAVALCSLLLVRQTPATGEAAIASSPDAWSPKVTLRTADGGYAAPIHAALMPNGNVLLFGIAGTTEDLAQSATPPRPVAFVLTPPPFWTRLPTQMTVSEIAEPVEASGTVVGDYLVNDSLVCAGHSLTADGKFFSVGGTRDIYSTSSNQLLRITAPSYSTIYDGTTWSRVPGEMVGVGSGGEARRWYPTVTHLPDNRMLITSGFENLTPAPDFNLSVEAYNPATGAYTLLSPYANTPLEILNDDYTHVGVLPARVNNSDLVMLGSPGVPVFMSLATNPATWRISTHVRPGSEAFNADRVANGGAYAANSAPDYGASSVMLPIRVNNRDLGYSNGTMLVAGGAMGTPFVQRIDRYDPQLDAWMSTIDTTVTRHHPMTLNLPDGRVLIIGGHSSDPNVTHAEYVDTMNNFAFSLGSSSGGEIRGYHAISLLLPDGRVLVAGGRDAVTDATAEKPTFRIYYPYYMFVSDRPAITSAPAAINFGKPFQVRVAGGKPTGAILISLGSMTHSFDENERSVQVAITGTTGAGTAWQATLSGPPSAQVAPAGYYMLFMLDSRRVPSMAKIVRLS